MRKKILYIIFNRSNRINIMNGEMLGYYFIFMIVIGSCCWIGPPLIACCRDNCCEYSEDEYDSDDDYEDDYEDDAVAPLSPASSGSSDGVYEMQLKPDYSSSEEVDDRWIRIKVSGGSKYNSEDEETDR